MSKIVQNGNSVDVTVQAGQSLKIAWLGGTYTATAVAGGLPNLPAVQGAANSSSDQTLGPYTNAVVIRIKASAIGAFSYDSGAVLAFRPPGQRFVRQSDGVPVVLTGVDTAAAFSAEGGGSSAVSAYPPNMFWKGGLAKIAAAKAANRAPRILVMGDSNAVGQGAGGGASGANGARELGWPVVMAKSLGWQIGSVFGDQNIGALAGGTGNFPAYDPRVAFGSGWGDPASTTFAGRFFQATGVSAGRLGFAHPQLADRVRVWYPTSTSGNTAMTVYCDGAVIGTINANAASGFTSQTYNVALGVHNIEIKSDGATNVSYISGIETWDSTSLAPRFIQGAMCGGKLGDLNASTNPFSYRNVMVALAVDAVVNHTTINDILQATAIDVISSGIDGLNYQAALSGADVINTVSWAFDNIGALDGTLDKIASLLRSSASAYNGAFADARAVMGSSWTAANTKGLAFDNYHPNPAGHAVEAAFFAKLFA